MSARGLHRTLLVAIVAMAFAMAGCGSASTVPPATAKAPPATATPSTGSSPGASTSSPSGSSPSASSPGSPPAAVPLAIVGTEYAFSTRPAPVAAGLVDLQFTNAGKEDHEAQLLTLDRGHPLFQVLAAASKPGSGPPPYVHGAGGVAAVAPGTAGSSTQVLQPGNYLVVCYVRTNGQPHVTKGMITALTVTGNAAGAGPPAGSGPVVAREYGFTVPSLKTGSNTIAVRNDGPNELHEFNLITLAPGVAFAQLRAALSSPGGPPPGPPLFTSSGGTSALDPGGTAVFNADLQPGASYAFICFVPDHAGGPPHAFKGMLAAVNPGTP